LSPRDRQVVALRFGSDMRNKDIAELMGLKEHTVSVILLRALERLRDCQEEP
jgi:RNA polymerase sigma-70 factor, ECF subfamily